MSSTDDSQDPNSRPISSSDIAPSLEKRASDRSQWKPARAWKSRGPLRGIAVQSGATAFGLAAKLEVHPLVVLSFLQTVHEFLDGADSREELGGINFSDVRLTDTEVRQVGACLGFEIEITAINMDDAHEVSATLSRPDSPPGLRINQGSISPASRIQFSFDDSLSAAQILGVLEALADFYRASGGIGFSTDLDPLTEATGGSASA